MLGPLQLHQDQPARLYWQGRAAFLLGSTKHYGALVDTAFDYDRYLDTIAADGLNLTRVFAFRRGGVGSRRVARLSQHGRTTP
jgi:hypothetical protein